MLAFDSKSIGWGGGHQGCGEDLSSLQDSSSYSPHLPALLDFRPAVRGA